MSYLIKRTLDETGGKSVLLVNGEMEIVEEVALFLNHLDSKGYSKNTIETYCRNLKQYYDWMEKSEIRFLEVTKRNIVDFVSYLNRSGKQTRSPKTINNYLAVVSSFYDYLEIIQSNINSNPITAKNDGGGLSPYVNHQHNKSRNLFRQKEHKKIISKRLSGVEVASLYDTIGKCYKNPGIVYRNCLIFRVLYETGIRVGECMGLKINDYSYPDPTKEVGIIYIRRHKEIWHKDHSVKTLERDIPVSMDLINDIEEYVINHRYQMENMDTIFVNHRGKTKGHFLKRNSITEIFRKISDTTGIKCTPHTLRHTHGTELIENGYDQEYVQERLGHSSILSTDQYIHLSLDSKVKAYERFLSSQERNK